MKFSFASFCLFLAVVPAVGWAQFTPQQVKPATDPRQISKSPTFNDRTFNAAANKLVESGALSERLQVDAEAIKKYAATITAQDLEAHLRFLASDELEGRETGTRGQKLAARYLSTQFQKMGLQPGNKGEWYQTYDLNRVTVNSATVSLTGKESLAYGEGFVCFNKAGLTSNLSLDYVWAGYGIDDKSYDNLQGLKLKDKMAVILAGEPMRDGKSVITGSAELSEWSDNVEMKARALQRKEARGALVITSDENFKRWAGSGWMKHMASSPSLKLAYKEEKNVPFTTIFISETMANTLLKKAKTTAEAQRKVLANSAEVGNVDLSKAKFTLTTDAKAEVVQAENVLGFIEGTDKKEEVVVITAHYDHLGIQDGEIFNGADDDGTGTVAVLEVAEAFAEAVKAGIRPRRSILFMPVSGEEKGLLGSEYYADHPVYPINKTVCDLNIDMIGRVDEAHKGEPQYIYIIGSDKLSTELHVANEGANKLVSNLELDYTFNSPDDPNRFYYRSDHYNFAKNNIPVIFYFSGVHEDYHKSTDDIEKILFPRAARVAQLVFATAWEVANRENKLVVNKKSDFDNKE